MRITFAKYTCPTRRNPRKTLRANTLIQGDTMTTSKNIFSFDINEAKTWKNTFDDNGELLITKKVQSNGEDYPFGIAEMMTIKEVKKTLENDFSYKRPLDITGAVRRMKAFRPDFMKPILISKVKGEIKTCYWKGNFRRYFNFRFS